MIWLPVVSYATLDPFTNCGDRTDASNVQRLRECAGSWMSRTTMVGSPTTVPMTRLSPAGTADVQWTSDAGPAVGLASGEADDAPVGVCVAAGGEPPHAQSTSTTTRTASLPRLRGRWPGPRSGPGRMGAAPLGRTSYPACEKGWWHGQTVAFGNQGNRPFFPSPLAGKVTR